MASTRSVRAQATTLLTAVLESTPPTQAQATTRTSEVAARPSRSTQRALASREGPDEPFLLFHTAREPAPTAFRSAQPERPKLSDEGADRKSRPASHPRALDRRPSQPPVLPRTSPHRLE